jgi:hypothetical protein
MNVWMISLVVCLIQPFDPHTTDSRINRAHLCSLLSQTMNHPYLYPDQAEWTEDYQDLKETRERNYPRAFDDEEEFLDALFWVV